MNTGLLVKNYGGFYYVFFRDELYECKIRGRLQKKINRVFPGEHVKFTIEEGNKGIIEDFLPRTVALKRPGIVNFDQLGVVASITAPKIDFLTIDKFLAIGEALNIKVFICINKIDLVDKDETIARVSDYYRGTPYQIFYTSTEDRTGLDDVKNIMKGTFTVLAGNSGVGKSSIINALIPEAQQKTNIISKKLNRGKNTTRHVELFALDEHTYVADSPGFSSLDIIDYIAAKNLPNMYPEYLVRAYNCNFRNCVHINEPKCAVKKDLNKNTLSDARYQNYKSLYNNLFNREV